MSTKIIYPIGGFAPGNYMNTCTECKEDFIGDKRAVQCEPCAINAVNSAGKKASTEVYKLKDALKQIKFSNDIINELLENIVE